MAFAYQGPGIVDDDVYTPDNLFAGDFPLVSHDYTVPEGTVLVRGTVVGKIGDYDSPGGEVVASVAAATDGSEDPFGILAVDVDATDAAVIAPVYETGIFNERALTIGTGHTLDSIREPLRAKGIHLKDTVAAGD